MLSVGLKSCCSASCFSQGYHLWASVMTGFQYTTRVCPSDTQKLGFSYICSSSLSVFSLSLHLSLVLSLPPTVTPAVCVFIWTVSVSARSHFRGGHVRRVIIYIEWNQSAQIFWLLWGQSVAQYPPSVLVVNFLERFSVSLHFMVHSAAI